MIEIIYKDHRLEKFLPGESLARECLDLGLGFGFVLYDHP